MNKAELTGAIAEKADITLAEAEKAVNIVLEGIVNVLSKGDGVTLTGFGNFGVKKRAARKVRNPQTGKEMTVDAKTVPFFKAGKKLKELVDTKE